mmetsp:Transcript_74106/g.239625  ORF Transcript_74106/g.239625 Transcript_74106/m.239625 type:complete len:218 (-) Transcript_74106:570-1223(-)
MRPNRPQGSWPCLGLSASDCTWCALSRTEAVNSRGAQQQGLVQHSGCVSSLRGVAGAATGAFKGSRCVAIPSLSSTPSLAMTTCSAVALSSAAVSAPGASGFWCASAASLPRSAVEDATCRAAQQVVHVAWPTPQQATAPSWPSLRWPQGHPSAPSASRARAQCAESFTITAAQPSGRPMRWKTGSTKREEYQDCEEAASPLQHQAAKCSQLKLWQW